MNPTQSNTQAGRIVRTTGAASLAGKEGFLALLVLVGAVGVVQLPAAITDVTPFLVDEGGTAGEPSTIDPLSPDRQYRVKGKGVIQPGAAMVLAAIAGDDAGKARQLPAAAGTYRVLLRCEEEKPTADGQLVLCRPSFEGNAVVA